MTEPEQKLVGQGEVGTLQAVDKTAVEQKSMGQGEAGLNGGDAKLAVGTKPLLRSMVKERWTGAVSRSGRVQTVSFLVGSENGDVRTVVDGDK